jgi:hypothetical protein
VPVLARRSARSATAAAIAALAALADGTRVGVAADPTSSPLAGDPRSAGEGPGLVGDPLFAIVVVLAIALIAIAITTLWVRATAAPSKGGDTGR